MCALLLRTLFILFQDAVDNTDEGIELWADRRPRPDITRRYRVAQHLPDRARVDPKATSHFSLAQSIYHHRVAHPRIQFHSLHPPPFASIRKGPSLTDFYSGTTRLSGRFNEGLLLRRSQADTMAVGQRNLNLRFRRLRLDDRRIDAARRGSGDYFNRQEGRSAIFDWRRLKTRIAKPPSHRYHGSNA